MLPYRESYFIFKL